MTGDKTVGEGKFSNLKNNNLVGKFLPAESQEPEHLDGWRTDNEFSTIMAISSSYFPYLFPVFHLIFYVTRRCASLRSKNDSS